MENKPGVNFEVAEKSSVQKDLATVKEVLDVAPRIERYIDELVYSAVKENYKTRKSITTKKTGNILKGDLNEDEIKSALPQEGTRYRRLPSEERLLSEAQYTTQVCERRYFMPDPEDVFAVKPELLDAYCVSYNEPTDEAGLSNATEAAKTMYEHLQKHHIKDNDWVGQVSQQAILQNARWLRWKPMMNRRGLDAYKGPILAIIDPLNATGIFPEKTVNINDKAIEMEEAIMQDIGTHADEYGFEQDLARVKLLQHLAYNLFLASFSRSLNGITLKLIFSTIEEKTYNIGERETGSSNQGIFNLHKQIDRAGRK